MREVCALVALYMSVGCAEGLSRVVDPERRYANVREVGFISIDRCV